MVNLHKDKRTIAIMTIVIMVIIASCQKLAPSVPPDDETIDHGPIDGLTNEQLAEHALGDQIFCQVFTASQGLGPIMVSNACMNCHAGNGKGNPFSTLTRFGQTDSTGNKFLAQGGPQLQNFALPGYQPEQIPAGATHLQLMPPMVTGMGFIEAVPDSEILAMAYPHNGISGVPNWNTIPATITPNPNDITRNGKYICRIGKKASVYNILAQDAFAFNEDLGITSLYQPIDVYSLQVIDPEISNDVINTVSFYIRTLAPSVQRNQNNPQVQYGNQLFINIGCEDCHKQTLTTGYSDIAGLSYQQFHPFSDLLLHDMGPDLDDGYTEGTAATSQWRTAPLWGVGLASKSQGGKLFLLHDGRAHSFEEAISFHGGEASQRRTNFNNLSSSDKQALLAFLQSL
jgi:CxxC motif-containing protein (DUF1111 family)